MSVKPTEFSKDIIDYILENYPKPLVTFSSLSKELGISDYFVNRIIKENGIEVKSHSISTRRYYAKDDFFDNLDTEEKQYFLGWIYADACHTPSKNQIVLRLQARDKPILEKLNSLVNFDRPLTFTKKADGQDQYALTINSENISKTLESYGVTARKSLTLEWPDWMPSTAWPAFLRGYLEGDGWIGWDGRVTILGSTTFCEKMREVIEKSCNNFAYVRPHPSDGISRLEITGIHNSKKFLDFVYSDATIYLERKYERYQHLIERCQKAIKGPHKKRHTNFDNLE